MLWIFMIMFAVGLAVAVLAARPVALVARGLVGLLVLGGGLALASPSFRLTAKAGGEAVSGAFGDLKSDDQLEVETRVAIDEDARRVEQAGQRLVALELEAQRSREGVRRLEVQRAELARGLELSQGLLEGPEQVFSVGAAVHPRHEVEADVHRRVRELEALDRRLAVAVGLHEKLHASVARLRHARERSREVVAQERGALEVLSGELKAERLLADVQSREGELLGAFERPEGEYARRKEQLARRLEGLRAQNREQEGERPIVDWSTAEASSGLRERVARALAATPGSPAGAPAGAR